MKWLPPLPGVERLLQGARGLRAEVRVHDEPVAEIAEVALDGGRGVMAPEAVCRDTELALDGHDAVGLTHVAPVGDAARGPRVLPVAGLLARDLAVNRAA